MQECNDARPLTTIPSSQKKREKVALDRVAVVYHPFPVEESRNYIQRIEKGRDRRSAKIKISFAHIYTLFKHVSNANVGPTLFDYPRKASENYSLKRGRLTLILWE